MAQPVPQSSRLVRFLGDIVPDVVSGIDVAGKNFADQLAQFIDLTDSITLSESLRSLSDTHFNVNQSTEGDVKGEFLRVRKTMVEFIVKSFVPVTAEASFKLPDFDEAAGFEPYQRFYSVHQSEMDARILKLRAYVRQQVGAHSQHLAQLVALDTALGNTLAAHSRQLFSAVPRLLHKRFQHLAREYQQSRGNTDNANTALPGWLATFHTDMQRLLLAELEVRLQPVLGLVEAFDVEVAKKQ